MYKSPLPTILLCVLALSVVASVVFCYRYVDAARELRGYKQQVSNINTKEGWMNAVVPELVEYSKRNPQIDPILETIGIRNPATATNKPSAK
jgi:hypothetical protein